VPQSLSDILMTNDMSGIDGQSYRALSGLKGSGRLFPRALPWAFILRPLGAEQLQPADVLRSLGQKQHGGLQEEWAPWLECLPAADIDVVSQARGWACLFVPKRRQRSHALKGRNTRAGRLIAPFQMA